MGWDFFSGSKNWTKKEFIENMFNDFEHDFEIINTSVKSDHVWLVLKRKNTEYMFIACCLIEKDGDWGYKYISESAGPVYYDCPKTFLKRTPPPPADDVYALEWRHLVLTGGN